MCRPTRPDTPDDARVKSWRRLTEVFHPFHPDEDNEAAFAHALKIASTAGARLSLMSFQAEVGFPADAREDEPWATLARWGALHPSGTQEEPELRVRRLQATGQNPVKACERYLRANPTDLVVLTTHLEHGRMTWMGRSVAEALAAKVGEMTLFLPLGAKGFVSWDDGAVDLQSILVAVAREPRPEPAIEAARRLMVSVPRTAGTVTLVHVGNPADMPELRLPDIPGWTWKTVCKQGDVVETILGTAAEVRAGLIVMTTAGHQGFLDVLRGTVTEHVLREARCPLLAMPVGSFLG